MAGGHYRHAGRAAAVGVVASVEGVAGMGERRAGAGKGIAMGVM